MKAAILALIILGYIVLCILAWRTECRLWNGGRCLCDGVWEPVGDFEGVRGYQCDLCGRAIWIVWPVDCKKRRSRIHGSDK